MVFFEARHRHPERSKGKIAMAGNSGIEGIGFSETELAGTVSVRAGLQSLA